VAYSGLSMDKNREVLLAVLACPVKVRDFDSASLPQSWSLCR
jgi:hypothetical protein